MGGAHFTYIFRHANLVLHYSATVGCNLLTVVMFFITSLPLMYRTMFVVPNVMLMNVMACRVFRNTIFGNQCMNPAISISSIAFQEPNANSSADRVPGLISETDNQCRLGRGAVGRKLESDDVIAIFPSHKNTSIQMDCNRGDSAV